MTDKEIIEKALAEAKAEGRREEREEIRKRIEKREIEWKEYARCHDSMLTKDGQKLKRKLLVNPYKNLLDLKGKSEI